MEAAADTETLTATPTVVEPVLESKVTWRKAYKDAKWRESNNIFEKTPPSVRATYNTMMSKMRNGGHCADEVIALKRALSIEDLLVLYESAIMHTAQIRQANCGTGGYYVHVPVTSVYNRYPWRR